MLLELKDICYVRDGKKILDKINLKIELGKFIVITGPNGSGKSTLAKIIAGVIKETSGSILYNGHDITELDMTERANLGIAFAFQHPVKFKGLTVYDILNIANGSYLYKDEAFKRLEEVGLNPEEYLYRELDSTLSGGELKRIEIATIVLRDAKLTLFDEPEAGIDLWSFNELIDLFKKIRSEIEGTTIIISHQDKIIKIADEIILLKNGKVDSVSTYDNLVKSGDL